MLAKDHELSIKLKEMTEHINEKDEEMFQQAGKIFLL